MGNLMSSDVAPTIVLHFGQPSLLKNLQVSDPELKVIPFTLTFEEDVWVFIDLNVYNELTAKVLGGEYKKVYVWNPDDDLTVLQDYALCGFAHTHNIMSAVIELKSIFERNEDDCISEARRN